MNSTSGRRKFLKQAGVALVALPILMVTRQAWAMTNTDLRKKFQYQEVPKDTMSCAGCLEFIPGKTDRDLGKCKVIPGDDEISPNGYCTKWNSM